MEVSNAEETKDKNSPRFSSILLSYQEREREIRFRVSRATEVKIGAKAPLGRNLSVGSLRVICNFEVLNLSFNLAQKNVISRRLNDVLENKLYVFVV